MIYSNALPGVVDPFCAQYRKKEKKLLHSEKLKNNFRLIWDLCLRGEALVLNPMELLMCILLNDQHVYFMCSYLF